MASPSCTVYTLFVTSIASLLLGIGTLIASIVFKYIGFVDSDVVLGICTQVYLADKYRLLSLHLQTAFVGICIGLLMNAIVLGLLVVTLKNLKSASLNPQIQYQTLPASVLSKTKIAAIYILLSFGALGSIVAFGYYLSIYIDAKKDTLSCQFNYSEGNLFILLIISGVWLLAILIEQVFTMIVSRYVAEQEVKEQRSNKYKEMINVTEEPGVPNQYGYDNQKAQDNVIIKGAQFTEQPSNGQLHSFGNQKPLISKIYNRKDPQNDKSPQKAEQYILKDMESSQVLKPYDTQNNFGGINNQHKNSFLYQDFNDNKNNTRQTEEKAVGRAPFQNDNNKNYNSQYSSGGSPNKSPGKFYRATNNLNYLPSSHQNDYNSQSIRNRGIQNQPEYNNPFSKPLSPIKQLEQSAIERPGLYSPSPIKQDPFKNVQMFTIHGKPQPQRLLNTGNLRDVDRPEQYMAEETKGQLMFHMKAVEEDPIPDVYKNDIQRFDRNSSGEVSFKSPSRFDSKFADEENKYLSRNTLGSILPALNRIKESEGSRKNGINDNFSSGGINSYFAQSRGKDSYQSPSSKLSRTKAREGVLTSFIRGKFA